MTNTLLSITLFNVSFIRNGAFSAFLVFLVTVVETEEKKMRAGNVRVMCQPWLMKLV